MAKLSQYRVLEKLGEGSSGTVFRAEDLRLGRSVAIKLLPSGVAPNQRARRQFLAEAQAVAALEHPNLCVLYEFEDGGDNPFLVMQLIEGRTLEQTLADGPLHERRACAILMGVGAALAAAHDRGILHRDVKSENILLGDDGSVKLADFGIALLIGRPGVPPSSERLGTPAYWAPEEIAGAPPTTSSDLYALAVVAFECLTGKLPFGDESTDAVCYSAMNRQHEPPTRLRPDLSPEWDALLGRALSKSPADRHPTVRAFVDAVAEIAATLRHDATSEHTTLQAQELLHQGQELYARYTHSDNLRALECFEHAAALTPDLATAWSGIADCCGQMHDKCWDVNPVWLDRGQAAAECAVQLDPSAPEGHKSLALIQLYRGDRPGACVSLRRAIEAKLDYLPAHVNLAAVLRADGDLAGAERSLRRALQIDPTQPFTPWALAHLLVFTRRYAEAIELCESFEGAGSPYYYVRARVWRATALAYLGKTAAAAESLAERGTDTSTHFGLTAAESLVSAMTGRHRSARRMLAELEIEVVHHMPLAWVLIETAAWLRDERAVVRLIGCIERKTTVDFAIVRLLPGVTRLDRDGPFERWMGERGRQLVWPLEAPPLTQQEKSRFRSFSERSGLPDIHATPNPVETLLLEVRERRVNDTLPNVEPQVGLRARSS